MTLYIKRVLLKYFMILINSKMALQYLTDDYIPPHFLSEKNVCEEHFTKKKKKKSVCVTGECKYMDVFICVFYNPF